MTSLKQIAANRVNALKSTGPRTERGKQRTRQNALRHGLTAETVVAALENAAEYVAFEASIVADYQPRSATESALVVRLASLLWRLRRSTDIETGLFQIQGEMMRDGGTPLPRRTVPLPEWYDELDTASSFAAYSGDVAQRDREVRASPQKLADCFLRVSRLGYGCLDLLNRYEANLWRQVAQLLFMLRSAARR